MAITFEEIRAAAKRIAGSVLESPCPHSIPLSEVTGMKVYCKLDYLQRTGSFKERGARNALVQLSPEQQRRGVVAASAGNHALGLAYHARLLGIPATVVMPRFAPLTKIVNCRRLGANVILHGANIAEARTMSDLIAAAEGKAYINGYDDPAIIAGQGTMGLEIMAQVPDAGGGVNPLTGQKYFSAPNFQQPPAAPAAGPAAPPVSAPAAPAASAAKPMQQSSFLGRDVPAFDRGALPNWRSFV